MIYLRQSTASQSVLLGPFVDDSDGKTPETGLTIANTDVRLSKNGTNIVAKESGGATHDENGFYTATFGSTDTDTLGRLQWSVKVAGALLAHGEFSVLHPDVWDGMFSTGQVPGIVEAYQIGQGPLLAANVPANFSLLDIDSAGGVISQGSVPMLEDLNDPTLTEIKAQIVAALTTDSYAEPSGALTASASLAARLIWLAALSRNKITQTATTQALRDDGDTTDLATAGVTYDGSTFTRDEWS